MKCRDCIIKCDEGCCYHNFRTELKNGEWVPGESCNYLHKNKRGNIPNVCLDPREPFDKKTICILLDIKMDHRNELACSQECEHLITTSISAKCSVFGELDFFKDKIKNKYGNCIKILRHENCLNSLMDNRNNNLKGGQK